MYIGLKLFVCFLILFKPHNCSLVGGSTFNVIIFLQKRMEFIRLAEWYSQNNYFSQVVSQVVSQIAYPRAEFCAEAVEDFRNWETIWENISILLLRKYNKKPKVQISWWLVHLELSNYGILLLLGQ